MFNASGIELPNWIKSVINSENDNDAINYQQNLMLNFLTSSSFFCQNYLLSQIYVNKITASGIMTNFVDKGLSRNTEIEIGPFWVLSNILRLEQVRDMYVSNTKVLQCCKMSGLQLATFLSYHKKLTGKGECPPPLPRLWLKKGLNL